MVFSDNSFTKRQNLIALESLKETIVFTRLKKTRNSDGCRANTVERNCRSRLERGKCENILKTVRL